MKRLLAIPILFFYMLAMSGALIQLHFCQEELKAWTINTPTADCCGEEAKQEGDCGSFADDCCTEKVLVLKAVEEQLAASAFQFLFSEFKVVAHQEWLGPIFQLNGPTRQNYLATGSPEGLWQDIPLFKLHQRFTLYG